MKLTGGLLLFVMLTGCSHTPPEPKTPLLRLSELTANDQAVSPNTILWPMLPYLVETTEHYHPDDGGESLEHVVCPLAFGLTTPDEMITKVERHTGKPVSINIELWLTKPQAYHVLVCASYGIGTAVEPVTPKRLFNREEDYHDHLKTKLAYVLAAADVLEPIAVELSGLTLSTNDFINRVTTRFESLRFLWRDRFRQHVLDNSQRTLMVAPQQEGNTRVRFFTSDGMEYSHGHTGVSLYVGEIPWFGQEYLKGTRHTINMIAPEMSAP